MNSHLARLLWLIVIVGLIGVSALAQETQDSISAIDLTANMTAEQLFEKAGDLYESRQYDQAGELYTTILVRGVESAPVYFNLGNAKFKAGDIGFAVLYYHRALRLEPGDEDIANNLEFASLFTSIQMEGVQLNPVTTFFESLVWQYKLSQLAWVSSAFFILLMILMIIRFGIGFSGPIIRVGITVSITLLILVGSLTSFKYRHNYLIDRGVIVASECQVMTGPSETLDVEFEAAPGLVVEILSESGSYYNVLFENKRRGWIKKHLVAVI